MVEVVEAVEEQPRTVAFFLAHEYPAVGDAAPDDRAAVLLRVHRDDARGGIPAPEPVVAHRAHERVCARHPAS